jgi:murein DD-endopeptidase MepM/ murein hydrolase activator NlpD
MMAGNHVVVEIGEARYAFYAHMQPGSLRVKVGDKVVTGQVLGLLGNSGNTDAPHLHFHVMDGPSPLVSNGLPYVFTSFEGQGVLRDEKPLSTGGEVNIDKNALAGPHKNQLPLNNEVVSFP